MDGTHDTDDNSSESGIFERRVTRRRAIGTAAKVGVTAVVAAALAGGAGYTIGAGQQPAAQTVTQTGTQAGTQTATQTISQTVTQTITQSAIQSGVKVSPYGGKLNFAIGQDVLTLNALESVTDWASGMVMSNLYNRMVNVDERGGIVPELAVDWELAKDKMSYRFTLREGVQFHKGYGELTADDVAWGVNHTITTPTVGAFLFPLVDSAKVVDKYTVEYDFKSPFGPFPIFLRETYVTSKKAYEERGDKNFSKDPIGTGPYEFVEWVSGDHVTMKRFDNYWRKDHPFSDQLVFQVVPDATVKESKITTGEVSIIDIPNSDHIKDLESNKDLRVFRTPGWNWDCIVFNFGDPTAPWAQTPNGAKVRQAVASAVDRNQIVQQIYNGEAIADDSPLPPGFLGKPQSNYFSLQADTAKATQLLSDAGFANGFDAKMVVADETGTRREAELIQLQLRKVGIRLDLQVVDTGTFINQWFSTKKFELLLGQISIIGHDPDPSVYWFHHSGTIANEGYSNPDVDKAIEAQRASSDPQERTALFKQLFDIVIPDAPYIYLNHVNIVNVARKSVVNFEPSPQRHVSPVPGPANMESVILTQ